MSVTINRLFTGIKKALLAQLQSEIEERGRLEEKRRQQEATHADWVKEQNRRRTRETVAAALEAKRLRNEHNETVWRTEEERRAAIDIEAEAEAKRALEAQHEQERLDFMASIIMRQQAKRR